MHFCTILVFVVFFSSYSSAEVNSNCTVTSNPFNVARNISIFGETTCNQTTCTENETYFSHANCSMGTKIQFQDFTPNIENKTIVQIQVRVYGSSCVSSTTDVMVNNEIIATRLFPPTSNCLCTSCALVENFLSPFIDTGLSFYYPGENNITVTSSGNLCINQVEIIVSYVQVIHVPCVESVFPLAGPFSGGTNITVYGSFFTEENISCNISGKIITPHFINSSVIVCSSPPHHFPRYWTVIENFSLLLGDDVNFGWFPFVYYDQPNITDIQPRKLLVGKSLTVTVYGNGFIWEEIDHQIILKSVCFFDDDEALNTTIVDSQTLLCNSPIYQVSDSVRLSVALNLVDKVYFPEYLTVAHSANSPMVWFLVAVSIAVVLGLLVLWYTNRNFIAQKLKIAKKVDYENL
eukprot:TRINITY_DN7948_c0_g1_i1.p1 TRINITY_DN7948_c0_g1~~TRINITY_DN7948_c0_g1_i1.p1  ORF type:complete len:406 (-),score=53.38 TRINITY_DN7948_c0_g1_i1:71-1288(-)